MKNIYNIEKHIIKFFLFFLFFKINMKYLREFVIGSSWLVVVQSLYNAAYNRPQKNWSYEKYSMIAPVWFGLWNVMSLIIATQFNLSLRMRFIVVSMLSYCTIIIIAKVFNTYNFTNKEWNEYYIYMLIKYIITWNIIVYYIEKFF